MVDVIVADLIERAKNFHLNVLEGSLKIQGAYEGESIVSINIKSELQLLDKSGVDLDGAEFFGTIQSIEELLALVPDLSEDLKSNESISLILNSKQ